MTSASCSWYLSMSKAIELWMLTGGILIELFFDGTSSTGSGCPVSLHRMDVSYFFCLLIC